MPRFMMVYKGEATDVSTMPAEAAKAIMDAWGVWMEGVGPSLVDVGAPFGPGTSVIDDGAKGNAVPASGYSIVEAADLDSAAALADGHPYLSEGAGNFAIDIYELMPVPFSD